MIRNFAYNLYQNDIKCLVIGKPTMEEEADQILMSCLTAIHAKADTTLDKIRTEIVIKEQRQDNHLSHILSGLQNKQYSL